jgi:DNA-binding SARP family transcriptional activator
VGLRLAAALAQGHFWSAYGMSEGRRWLERGLARSSTSPTSVRAKALKEAGWIATHQGDYEQAVALIEEGMALFKELENKAGVAASIFYLGHLAVHGVDRERARALSREAEALLQELVDQQAIAQLLYFLGATALCEGEHVRGLALLEESLALNRELGDLRGIAICLTFLGITALEQGDAERAAALYGEDMRVLRGLRDKLGIAYGLRGLSCVAALQGDAARAAQLWGAAEAVGQTIGLHLSPFDRSHPDYEGLLAAARSQLDEASWEAARSEGKAMTPEEAIEYALAEIQDPPRLRTQQPAPPPATGLAPQPEKAPLELRIFALGGARIEVAGHTLTSSDFGYAKPRELLFYLLSHPPRTREQIGLSLWPEASSSQLRGSFHEALRRLRKALGGAKWIVHENKHYSFNRSLGGSSYYFDVEAFEQRLAEARRVKEESSSAAIVHLKEAVGLYRGDFLEGFVAEGEWALVRQEELRRSYQDALLDLGELLFSEGNYSESAEAYRKIIAMDRYSEASHRELMRSEAASGQRGRALERYRSLVELLQKELGTSPAPETVALHEDILRGEEV